MFETLNRQDVEAFVKNHVENIHEHLLTAIVNILPHISNYHEEEKCFSFRIILGAGELPAIKGRPHLIKTLPTKDLTLHMVTKSIKNLTTFCSNGADILIQQNQDSISFGVVYFDIEQTGLAEISFLRKGYVVMGSINQTNVVVFALDKDDKPENLILSFDFKSPENLPIPNFSQKYNRDLALWAGIFRRAKKEVHGTICLIVSPEWSWEADKHNFSRGEALQEPVSIAYGDGTDSTRKLDDGIRMLLSMMDFDGMTIIDTQGNIRAYHCFVKIEHVDTSLGGSRHIALSNLKLKDNNFYKAVYFQSHEGFIEFTYMDGPNEGLSVGYFDPTVMSPTCDISLMERFLAKARKRKELRSRRKSEHKNDLLRLSYMLFVSHYRMDNFNTEPEYAASINKLLDDKSKVEELESNETLAMFLIDTLLICFAGNTYGYSLEAEAIIKEIFKKITLPVWMQFFNHENHLEDKVMETLSDGESQKRWKIFKAEIEKIHPELKRLESLQNINVKDFFFMNKAFHCLKNEK